MYNFKFKKALRSDFARDENGSSSIETIIMVPMIFFVVLSIFTLFDAFRQYTMHQKAAYTLGDMISRETLPIDGDYLDGTHALFNTLTRDPQDSSVRVSILRYDSVNEIMKLDWSKSRGSDVTELTNHNVRNWTTKLPVMIHNERIIVVETFAHYAPPFETGLEQREIRNFIFTRPRYAPQVLWTDS
jgi:Flp pilus assembly protein TadG